MFKIIFLILTLVASSLSCTRNESTTLLKVSFQIPPNLSGENSSQSLPAGKKACYGVHVTGAGITSMPQTCGAQLGIYSGFVEEGGTLSLEVPRGDGRAFELIAYLVPSSETCPAWTESFGSTTTQLQSTYSVGKTLGVKLTEVEQSVAISYSFPGEANHLNATQGLVGCVEKLKGVLYSNGDVEDSSGNIVTGSAPMIESFYRTSLTTDVFGLGFLTSSGLLNFEASAPLDIPPYVRSVTRKPDTGAIYGLVGEGQIVSIAWISNGATTITELTAANCPFAVDNCQVPVWLQSISAGYFKELYGLDHAGNIYQLYSGAVAQPTTDTVPENVTQVSYY